MQLELVTKKDFQDLKVELIDEIKKFLSPATEQKEWLKSADVMSMLACSPGTLQNLRVNGTLPFTKMGGTIYYSRKDVLKVLEGNKQNAA
jgi:hypothetical protein